MLFAAKLSGEFIGIIVKESADASKTTKNL